MRPIVYLQFLTSVLWTIPNITQNCTYTSNATVIDSIKNTIENQTNSTAISMMQKLPYSKLLGVDVSNLIDLFKSIVQSINLDSSISSSKVYMIKYNIFRF